MPIEKERSDAVEREAGSLKRAYGRHASVYAEVRAEAAATRGAGKAAELWKDVEQKVDESAEHDGIRT